MSRLALARKRFIGAQLDFVDSDGDHRVDEGDAYIRECPFSEYNGSKGILVGRIRFWRPRYKEFYVGKRFFACYSFWFERIGKYNCNDSGRRELWRRFWAKRRDVGFRTFFIGSFAITIYSKKYMNAETGKICTPFKKIERKDNVRID